MGVRRWAYKAGLSAALALLTGCGSDANLNLTGNNTCGGGSGPQVSGTVSMPNGRVALAPSLLERFVGLVVAPAEAISGSLKTVGRGVTVELVELRQDDITSGTAPGVVEAGKTRQHGAYCVGLRANTDRSVCRYMLQVGNRDDNTLTRAFVFGGEDEIDIDYRSEAAVRAVLAQIPPATLCEFDRDDLRSIYDAVLDAPGTVDAADAAEANAIAATIAINDPGVQAAIAAARD
ncbi:MAG: hypothetical protein ABI629_23935 [bacterium]